MAYAPSAPARPWPRTLLLAGLVLAMAGARAAAPLDSALAAERRLQQESAQAQRQVDELDDEARRLLEEYRQLTAELDDLLAYNEGLARTVQAQEADVARMQAELASAEVTRREIRPLMDRMDRVLGEFVARDLPFLPEERQARIERLRLLAADPAAGVGERYRAILEAYQVEAGYGQGVEAYRGRLGDGSGRMVDFLRLGRVALYYLTPDGVEAGVWDPAAGAWRRIDDGAADLGHALRVARKELPPDLLTLPVPAPGVAP